MIETVFGFKTLNRHNFTTYRSRTQIGPLGHNHLAINSTTSVAGKAGFTLASAATVTVQFMAK